MHYDKTSITIHDIQMIDLSECLAIRKIVKQKVGKQKGGQQKGGQQKGGKQKVGQQDKQRVQDHFDVDRTTAIYKWYSLHYLLDFSFTNVPTFC